MNNFQKQELAYLIGAVIGDGCYTTPTRKYKSRFRFSSSDKEFVFRIKSIIKNIFSIDTGFYVEKLSLKNKNWGDHYIITSRPLPKFLKLYLPDKNKIPLFIKNSNNLIKARFLSGFFDAEGGICISTIKSRKALDRRLYCHNSNLELLKKIKDYLEGLDIDCFIQRGKRAYAFNIWGYKNLVNFKNIIDFYIYRKRDKLLDAIYSYKLIHKKYRKIVVNTQKQYQQEANKMTEENLKVEVRDNKREDDHTVFIGTKPFNVFS